MKISYNLLKDFLPDLNKSPQEIAEQLSLKLAEVESVNRLGDDHILEIENKSLTNRPDCFSHWGIARDLAAYYQLKIGMIPKIGMVPKIGIIPKLGLEISLRTPSCVRYIGAVLSVEITQSPNWLIQFIESMGLRPVNNVVDITNYIMLKYGQPLHAFDALKLKMKNEKLKVIIRQTTTQETITTIDGKLRVLDESMMVIADSKKPIAIAGVMGGKETEITDRTTEIVLEAANFEMYSIRKTSNQLGLRTDASTRFEKNQDPNLASIGFNQAVDLLKRHANTTIVSSITDVYPKTRKDKVIKLNPDRVDTFLGINLTPVRSKELLESLQLKVEVPKEKSRNKFRYYKVTVPTFRSDLNIEEDLLEELARLYGYNKIQPTLPARDLTPTPLNKNVELRRRIKQFLQSLGFNEIYNYSFTNEETVRKYEKSITDNIKLKNPLSAEHTHIRQSLLPGLLEICAENRKRFDQFQLFEIGKHIKAGDKGELPTETEHLALVETNTKKLSPLPAYFSLKGKTEQLLSYLGNIDFYFNPTTTIRSLDKSFQVEITNGQKQKLGHLGLVSSTIKENFTLSDSSLVVAEINLDMIYNQPAEKPTYHPVYSHPEVKQDLSMIINKNVNLGFLTESTQQAGGKLLQLVEIFDVFTDEKKMNENEKSISLHLTFQSPFGSLSHQEVSKVVEKIYHMIESEFQGKVRR
ncbi:phenylalanine--tRNA ligase subunit beta [Patescibacteria group bacterium]|nr:phenylalanine--tRNA ligase subunit beta [Patescibacteria group bacterium]MBU1868125.1 phenylalanine--tRNA ligase subunit beta [Patescibacteria group bacterium]